MSGASEDCNDVLHERELREMWEKEHSRVHIAEHEAIAKAESAVNQRLEGMNELRSQINAERGRYVTRENFETVNSSVDTRLKMLENKSSNTEGRMWVIGAVVIVINVAIALAVLWGHK